MAVLTVSTEAFLCGICINLQKNQNQESLLYLLQKAEDWKGSDHIVVIWIWLIANETHNLETVFKQLVILLYFPNLWFILLLSCLKKQQHSGLFLFLDELRKYSWNHTWLPLHYILNPFLLLSLSYLLWSLLLRPFQVLALSLEQVRNAGSLPLLNRWTTLSLLASLNFPGLQEFPCSGSLACISSVPQ